MIIILIVVIPGLMLLILLIIILLTGRYIEYIMKPRLDQCLPDYFRASPRSPWLETVFLLVQCLTGALIPLSQNSSERGRDGGRKGQKTLGLGTRPT